MAKIKINSSLKQALIKEKADDIEHLVYKIKNDNVDETCCVIQKYINIQNNL